MVHSRQNRVDRSEFDVILSGKSCDDINKKHITNDLSTGRVWVSTTGRRQCTMKPAHRNIHTLQVACTLTASEPWEHVFSITPPLPTERMQGSRAHQRATAGSNNAASLLCFFQQHACDSRQHGAYEWMHSGTSCQDYSTLEQRDACCNCKLHCHQCARTTTQSTLRPISRARAVHILCMEHSKTSMHIQK